LVQFQAGVITFFFWVLVQTVVFFILGPKGMRGISSKIEK